NRPAKVDTQKIEQKSERVSIPERPQRISWATLLVLAINIPIGYYFIYISTHAAEIHLYNRIYGAVLLITLMMFLISVLPISRRDRSITRISAVTVTVIGLLLSLVSFTSKT